MAPRLALLLMLALAAPGRGAAASGGLALTGIIRLGNETQVCLSTPGDAHAVWYVVGSESPGMWVESFDPQTEEVVVCSGPERIRLGLRQAVIQELGVARLDDGSVDWIHMKMSDNEKAREAQMLMWDILEVGRLARAAQQRSP